MIPNSDEHRAELALVKGFVDNDIGCDCSALWLTVKEDRDINRKIVNDGE
jgi:hypothetical protein